MNQITIGVSGINAVDNPGPGVGIARALKEDEGLNASIVGLAYDAMEPGVYLEWLMDKTYIIPYPSTSKEALLERLAYIKATNGLDFIFPNLDAELPFYTQCQKEIEDMGIGLFVPTPEQFHLRGKDRLPEVAERVGIDIPRTVIAYSYAELLEGIDTLGLPLMVKGALYKAYRAHTSSGAVGHFNKITAEWGVPIILQQVVTGEELNVVGVGDGQGNLIGQVGIKKMWITELGKIWTGVTIRHEKMLEAAEDFVRTYKWKGPFELECIVDGDTVYLIEINPRFPAWSYFAAGVGVNLPANTVRTALNMPLTDMPEYEPGKLYIRYTYETIKEMSDFQRITLRGEN